MRLTPWHPTTTLEEEQRRAMRGEIVDGERLNENGERVVSVTLPLRRVQRSWVRSRLESADVERILVAERASMIPFMIGATMAIFLSSLLLATVYRPATAPARAARPTGCASPARRACSAGSVHAARTRSARLAHSLEAMTGALADRIDANERFAADVSHEIKNPLASIQSAVDIRARRQ